MAAVSALGAAIVLAWAIVAESAKKLQAYDGNYSCTSQGCVQDRNGKFRTWGECTEACVQGAFYECARPYATPNGSAVYDPSKPCVKVPHTTPFGNPEGCARACAASPQYFDPQSCNPSTAVTKYKGVQGFEACMKALGKKPDPAPKCPDTCRRSNGQICNNGVCQELTCADVCPGYSGGGVMGWRRGALVDANGCAMNCSGASALTSCNTCAGEMCYTCSPIA